MAKGPNGGRRALGLLSLLVIGVTVMAAPSKPDVLFIVVDDMNNWISLLDSKSPIKTPNLERLARQGMLFKRAYCISAACNPSRTATMTGLRPSTTGVYGNKSNWRKIQDCLNASRHNRIHNSLCRCCWYGYNRYLNSLTFCYSPKLLDVIYTHRAT